MSDYKLRKGDIVIHHLDFRIRAIITAINFVDSTYSYTIVQHPDKGAAGNICIRDSLEVEQRWIKLPKPFNKMWRSLNE